jgi:hypothetical protein
MGNVGQEIPHPGHERYDEPYVEWSEPEFQAAGTALIAAASVAVGAIVGAVAVGLRLARRFSG